MPTFESINFSRELASRLVAIDKGDSVTPVETPQALLSRNPQSLRLKNEDGTISTDPLHCNGFPELRREVATKLVGLSLSGKRHAWMESVLQQQEQQEEAQQEHERSVALHKIPGCVSVVELLKYQKALASSNNSASSISTGSSTLDHLLAIPTEMATSLSSSMNPRLCIPMQGLPWGTVIQCSGAAATGKTQVALQVAVSAASQNVRVLYISSAVGQGSLKPLVLRLRELACAVATSRTQVVSMMDLVSFQTVEDGYQLLTCLAELEESCLDESQQQLAPSNEQQQPASTIRVVILDAASGCLTTEDESLLQRVALRLKQLARHYNLLVWINNSSTTPRPKNLNHQRHSIDGTAPMGTNSTPVSSASSSSSKPKVALGSTWKQAWDIHVALKVLEKEPLLLQQQEQPPPKLTVQATLEGHPFKRCNDSLTAEFCIAATGIQDSQPVVEEEEDEMA